MGVGLFSGVTTALYPLSVIKTRQMANNKVSGGLSGTKQTAVNIWQREGVKGFYRGFGTVVFGTIPSRSIYLSTLEMTKSAVQKLGQQAELSPTTLAATSSFLAGAAASLSTQIVIVPVDVISQRLMVQGDEMALQQKQPQPAAAAAPSTSNPATASNSNSTVNSSTTTPSNAAHAGTRTPAATAAAPNASSASSSSAPPAAAAGTAPKTVVPANSRQYHSGSEWHTASSSSSRGNAPRRIQLYLSHQLLQRQGPHQSWSTIPVHTSSSSSGTSSSSHAHYPSSNSSHRCSTINVCNSSSTSGILNSSRVVSRGLSSSAAAKSAPLGPKNGFQMARAIVAQEGFKGLYRGFWPSVATFAPSSAVWWGSYGFWQKLIWINLDPEHDSSSSGRSMGSSGQAASTGQVVVVQTVSAVLAGCTASLGTNPLDVVKTRLQVREGGELMQLCFSVLITSVSMIISQLAVQSASLLDVQGRVRGGALPPVHSLFDPLELEL